MIFSFNVQEPYRSFLLNGRKTIEGRLNKGKFQKIEVGDFLELETGEKFLVKNKYIFASFYEMITEMGFEKIIPDAKNIDDAVQVYYKFYTKAQEKEFGVVGIEVEKISQI